MAEQVVTLRLAEAEQLVKSDNPVDLERARNLLGEYESRFPQGGAPAALAVRKVLADKARALIAEAQRLSETDRNAARNLLNTAEALDPESEKLRTARSELRAGYPTLVVAARQRPELMSPALARFDSERQAVELMFEPLLDAVPDEVAGQRYEPQLAASLPGAGAGLREIQLAGPANWNLDGAGAVRAADVSGTARLLRQIPGTWSADRLQWLADPGTDPADPTRLRQRLTLGHPDPRSLLSGKILPASWLLARIRRADDPDFARKPFGSGPYRLLAETPKPGAPPPSTSDVVFVANPSYARRPGKANTPRIREVRFTPLEALKDPPGEFRAGKLHVLTDVPTRELVRYAADNNLNNKVRLVTAADPRRVHVLMVNHRNPALQNPDIRRGIALAVNREKIVDTVFRSADRPEVRHAAMTGPFPPGSWATPKGRPALDQRELGAAKIRGYLAAGGSVNSLTLLYPAGDLEADLACSSIRDQIQPLTAADERKFTLTIQAVSPAELFQRVHVEHRYELAYCPLDYPDSFAPLTLMSLLDPNAAGPLGRNALGYLGPNTTPTDADLRLGQTLSELRKHRDFTGRLVPLAEKLHQQFNDAMPFIPLWQLDRHMVLARGVQVAFPGQPEAADPRRLDFTRLEQFRLTRACVDSLPGWTATPRGDSPCPPNPTPTCRPPPRCAPSTRPHGVGPRRMRKAANASRPSGSSICVQRSSLVLMHCLLGDAACSPAHGGRGVAHHFFASRSMGAAKLRGAGDGAPPDSWPAPVLVVAVAGLAPTGRRSS